MTDDEPVCTINFYTDSPIGRIATGTVRLYGICYPDGTLTSETSERRVNEALVKFYEPHDNGAVINAELEVRLDRLGYPLTEIPDDPEYPYKYAYLHIRTHGTVSLPFIKKSNPGAP